MRMEVGRSEALLVGEAKAGSYEAFEELVNRYEKRIYRLGLNITGSREDAEDVLQETFLKAFEHLAEFREESRFYTWIVRIGTNEALMQLRRRHAEKIVSADGAISDEGEVIPREFADWKPNPEQAFIQSELETILEEAARSLPFKHRAVFFLRDGEEFSTEETAEILSVSSEVVKTRLFRARLRLREELSKVLKRG